MISLLYVDDEPELLNLGKLFLEREGEFSVTTTASSPEGLELMAGGTFDAIISDYQMPVMDGIEFLKQVRGMGRSTPFILFTGKGREEVVIEAINNGADFYLQKGGDARPQFAELRHKILAALERRRAVDALRDSEQRLSDIINFLPDATFAIDTAGKIIAWNKAIEMMTGMPATDMVGRGQYEYAIPFYTTRRPILIDLVLSPDEQYTKENYHDLLNAGTTITAETVIEKPGSDTVHIWAKASRLYDKNGNITGAIESVRDVTGQKKVDQTLRESEAKYRELVENANSIILKLDKSGNITFFNEFAQRFFGFTATEILGKPVVGTVVPAQESGSDRDLSHMIENIIRHPEDYVNNENENVTKNGDRVWIHWWNKPIYDRDGVFEGVLCVGTDITARKRIEDELRMENEKNRGLMNHAIDAIVVLDAETSMFTDANHRALELFGKTLAELRAMNFTGIFPAEFHEKYQGYFTDTARKGTGSHSLLVTGSDGRLIPVIVSSTAIDLGGRRHVMGIFHDISEIQMAQDALQLANKKLNLLSEITRHDIRNKLTVLGGYIELVRDHPQEPEYTMYVRKIQEIVGTIGENIEFTKLYQNLGVAAPGWQNVHDVFFHACARLDIRKIFVQSDTGDLEVFADPLLERAFYNLAENAIQHGGNVTTLRISAQKSRDGVTVMIEDNGMGVPPSDKISIFSKGFGKNTGLGLFLVREILSITGISITEIGEYHKGARFEIRVPHGKYRYSANKMADRCHIQITGSDAPEIPGNSR
ncbi:MAG: PAS domain S-box protein [Methanoregula sp.]|uniref:PAS domain S-box protein n=1 Tax=Methanoregula sp. TaxID=2052170 RepID=UPI0025F7CAB2|nr:response regulator [Methanoregula sp.]MCK9631241.1 PAS domain S-box protein [Methanoregula sp.]